MAGYKRSSGKSNGRGGRRGGPDRFSDDELRRPAGRSRSGGRSGRFDEEEDEAEFDGGRHSSVRRRPSGLPPSRAQRRMRQEEDRTEGLPTLAELHAEVFSLAIELRRGGELPDVQMLRRELLQEFDEIKTRAAAAHISGSDVDHARYAVVALLDETVLHSASLSKEAWLAQPLQMQLYGENIAGEGFFERLATLRRGRGSQAALQVFYVCLALGFEGRYRMAAGNELVALREELARELAPRGRRSEALSPHGARPDSATGEARRIPIYTLAAAFIVLVLVALGALGRLVAADARELGTDIVVHTRSQVP